MSVELILWVDSVVFDAWFLISTALPKETEVRELFPETLTNIRGIMSQKTISASSFKPLM